MAFGTKSTTYADGSCVSSSLGTNVTVSVTASVRDGAGQTKSVSQSFLCYYRAS